MGFIARVFSKMKRLFCSRQVNKNCPDESVINKLEHGYTVNDYGSKEDSFFDTKVWLDSDCEDDFYSVNGEFTPESRTPNRFFAPVRTPQKNFKAFDEILPDNKSESSPSAKKNLAELLQDSLSEQSNIMVQDDVKPIEGMNDKSAIKNEELIQFSSSSEGSLKPKKDKLSSPAACCLPGLVPGLTSKKQKMVVSH